jgi:hypothetical protein
MGEENEADWTLETTDKVKVYTIDWSKGEKKTRGIKRII